MTDAELLDEVLARELPEEAFEAFADMRIGIVDGTTKKLTPKQRSWVESVARAVGVDLGAAAAENLVSSGRVKPSPKERTSVQKFLTSLGPLPMKPPGRR